MYPRRYIGGLLAAAWVALAMPAAAQTNVLVFAAASMKEALDGVAAQWQRETGRKAVISYAASSALARQIGQGAPAQIFISADLDWMDYVENKKLIKPATRTNLFGNRIVLIAPRSSTATIKIEPSFPLATALGSGRLALADVNAVPAGKYGKAALEKLGVWNSVQHKVAQAENVRAALLLVSRGEAPLGIVYQTDATADPGVKIVGTFPEEIHPPIVYPAALTASTSNPDAEAFLAYMNSPKARPLFAAQGFVILD